MRMPDAVIPQEPPTGKPWIPPAAVPWLAGLVGVAFVGTQVLPEHTVAARICTGIVMLGSTLGLLSPGWRRSASGLVIALTCAMGLTSGSVAAAPLRPGIPITPVGVVPGWQPGSPSIGAAITEILTRTAESAPTEYAQLSEREKKCWWATQLHNFFAADHQATGFRLALAKPSATGAKAGLVPLAPEERAWLEKRQEALWLEAEKYEELKGKHCPPPGSPNSGAASDFDSASFTWLYGQMLGHRPSGHSLWEFRMVMPSAGWTVQTTFAAELELRRRKYPQRDLHLYLTADECAR